MTRRFTHGKIVVELIYVTPALAEEWLEANYHNRPLKGKLGGMARDMREGHWQFNGDTVRFTEDGELLDGQHRLYAIIESGTTQLLLVVRGLERPAQKTMDQGTPRSHGDQFRLSELKNSELMASTLSLIIPISKGQPWAKRYKATFAEKDSFLLEHEKDVETAVAIAMRAKGTRLPLPPSVIGAAYYFCQQINAEDAHLFFVTRLIDGVGCPLGDPALALRSRFSRAREAGTRVTSDEALRLALHAWNNFRDGKTLAKIQIPAGGWTRDNFPHPR